MKIEVLKKEDIPDWDYGDVTIKKFSFGDKIKLSSLVSELRITKDEVKGENKQNIDVHQVTLYTFAAGIHSVKKADNYEFELKPNSHINEKLEFVDSDCVSFEAGNYISTKIGEFNKSITEDLKKKS